MKHPRTAIGALSLSAAAFVALLAHEGYTDKAVIPIPGDRPTVGFGSTFNENGTPVKMGDTITPQKAARLSITHIAKDEAVLRKCVTGDMYQPEWDVLLEFSYWYGAGGTCKTDVIKHINAGRYADQCAAYLRYRRAAGKDCSDPANKCRGVWLRAQERAKKCMEVQ